MKSHRIWMVGVLIFCLVFGSVSGVFAASASDIAEHWAEDRLHDWIDRGLLSGYEDGTIRPNKPVTRAEFVSLVNRAFDFSEGSSHVPFFDVSIDHWSRDQIANALHAGYIRGYEDGTFRPDREVSRQEVAVMVAAILQLDSSASADATRVFTDAGQIAGWSIGAVGAIAEQGVMRGYEDGSFQPTASITRAEAVVTIDNALAVHENLWAAVYSEAGTFGPERGTDTIQGNVLVKADGVTLRNLNITGDLLLSKDIGEGKAALDNVTVEGRTTVAGGGENSIYVNNSKLNTVIVSKKNGNVRIVSSGKTTMELVRLTGNGTIILSGNFTSVQIDVPGAILVLESGTIDNLTVTADADSAKIHIANGAKVKTLTLHAAVEVTGKGTIEKAIIHAKGSRFEQEPWQIELADGVTVEVAGKMINESTRPAFIGGLGGRSSKGQTSKKVVKIEAIHDVWLLKGDDKDISVVTDPEEAGFTAASSDPSVVEAVYQLRETGEKIITVTGLAVGSATVTVDVYQDGYKDATETFTVTVLQTIEVVENETVKFESAGGLELDHLPGGAKIGATLVEVKGVEAAGPIVNIIFDGVVPEDGVVVRLPVQTENAGLYFYNEDDGTWELQEGSKIVEIDGQRFVEATVYHFSIYGALVNTADLIANNIKHIADPDAGATVLKLPEVPSGFTVAIHYSSDTGVIAKDGTITPPAKDTTVTLVLEVTREADGSSAKTSEFKVKIPGIDPGVDPGVDSYTLEFVANPADAVTRLTYQIGDGEELEVIDNKIEVPANTESLALYAYSLDGKSMINWDVEGFGGFYVTHKGGVLNNEKDSLHLHGGRIENDSTVHFNYVNTPDMYRSEFRFTPGAPGTKSFDAVIEVRDANGDPIVGIGPSNIGLILYTDYNQPNVLSLSNFFNYPNFNGVKVTNMDDDFSDHVFSFTVTFTEDGIDEKDNNQNLFTHVGHGDKLEFDLRILQVLREGFTVDLPTEGDSE